jgi:flagellar biosynthesis/type III secretory pathway chaperone
MMNQGGDMMNRLQELLECMSECANRLEHIIVEEREAAHRFDGDALIDLIERRVVAYQELTALEGAFKELLAGSGLPEEMTLESFVDLYAGADHTKFHSLRRKLHERMKRIEKENSDNRVRLHAAYDVTTNVLQHVGMLEQRQTYGPVK